MKRYYSFAIPLCLLTFLTSVPSWAQDTNDVKRGVVKITAQAQGKDKVGTGFIVRLDKESVYIVTASHVIEGDPTPQITFFPQPDQSFTAQIIGIESENQKGLASLRVSGLLPGDVMALTLDRTSPITGGEPVMFIGFPRTLAPWAVATGNLSGLKGLALTFQALVEEGHSGGPLLLNGKVIGVVTDARERMGYAVPTAILDVALKGWQIMPEGTATREIIGKDGASMVLVQAGRFPTKLVSVTGRGEIYEVDAGAPLYRYVADDFYIDKSLVPVSRFRQFLQSTGHRAWGPYGERSHWGTDENQPIDNVPYDEAVAYCKWARKRLPTEDEWEKAARDTKGGILDAKVTEWTSSSYDESNPEIQGAKTIRGSLSAFRAKPIEGTRVDYQVRKHARPGHGFEGFRCALDAQSPH